MWYFHIVIMFAIYFIIGALPPVAGITEMGMDVLGVTFALLYGWIMLDLLWTSLLGFVLLDFSGYTSILEGLAAGIGNSTVMMTLVLLAFAAALSETGVSEMLASWLISRKCFIGRPMLFIFGLMFGTMLISAAGGGMAVIFIMWDLLRQVRKLNGVAERDTLFGTLMGMIMFCGMVGFILPWQNTMWLFGGFLQKAVPDFTVPAMGILYAGIIVEVGVIALMIVVLKYVLRMDFSKLLISEELVAKFSNYKATKYQKAGLIALGIYIALLLFGNIFKTLPVAIFINRLGVTGLSILYMTVFCIWKKEDGTPVLNIMNAFKATPWAVILLIAVTIPLGDALQSADTGVMAAVSKVLYPLVSRMSPAIFCMVCCAVLTILTQFLHNVICGAVFLPMLTPMVMQMGGNPYVFFFMCFIGLMSAYATPAASMFAGLVFGTPDIGTKAGYLSGWLYTGLTIVLLCLLMPIWEPILMLGL